MSEVQNSEFRILEPISKIIQAICTVIVAYIGYKKVTFEVGNSLPATEDSSLSELMANYWYILIILLIIIFLMARRRSFVIENTKKGNYLHAVNLRTPGTSGLRADELRFVRRLELPWWKNWYWLIAGGRALRQP